MKKKLANRFMARIGMVGAIASTMLVAFPALAQDSRLSLAERVALLEQQAQNKDKNAVGMVNQMQQLQSQLAQLQGQVEELQHQLQDVSDKGKAQYVDLDSRLGRLESGSAQAGQAPAQGGNPPPPTSVAPPAQAPPAAEGSAPPPDSSADAAPQGAAGASSAPPSADEQAAYGTAFNAIRGGDYAQASKSFRDFLQKYPNSSLAPNALYWLGESYYVTTNYSVALQAFQQILSQFPTSEKAPDALLKVGYTQFELKQVDAAKSTLKDVLSKYPGSKAAGLAQERLNRIQLQAASAQ